MTDIMLTEKNNTYSDSPIQADDRPCLGYDHPIEKYEVIDVES